MTPHKRQELCHTKWCQLFFFLVLQLEISMAKLWRTSHHPTVSVMKHISTAPTWCLTQVGLRKRLLTSTWWRCSVWATRWSWCWLSWAGGWQRIGPSPHSSSGPVRHSWSSSPPGPEREAHQGWCRKSTTTTCLYRLFLSLHSSPDHTQQYWKFSLRFLFSLSIIFSFHFIVLLITGNNTETLHLQFRAKKIKRERKKRKKKKR